MSNFVNLLDIVYPVDSVYITFSATSPADTIGGTWELLENKFLYSSANATGIIGGEETHVLTVNEMPKHSHYVILVVRVQLVQLGLQNINNID